ncbi:PWWP domain containing protein [Trema orientale]|uniref:PWWP domain containing protein n=1 Tax=Trema orientale TaxID=63057 RepID=A0A2P5CN28_TREOI|nr:PWWP domain containing protein [Trema orientale]
MESTDSGVAEFSVGSIVWVRRRNGSWWPGKIVGPEELSASHLTSPRSGTPVKLLGREDASVDWYNLEKSKRVKAFRCGEFDDCIERAESSQGMPIKKREKYARREDAILHALELEKQQTKKPGKLGIASDRTNSKSSGAVKKGLVTPSESFGNYNVKLGDSKSNQFSKRLDVSPKNETLGNPLSSQKSKDGNHLSGEEDHSEVTPRMRGLQDLGLRIGPSKTKLPSSVASNGSRKPIVDNSVQALPCGGLKMGNTSHVNGKNSLDKGKRIREGLSEECLVKRRDKRRTLVQVLQNSAKLEVPDSLQPDSATVSTSISGVEHLGVICRAKRSRCVYYPAESSESLDNKAISQSDVENSDSHIGASLHPNSLTEENISGSTEDESDTSETDSSESESDSSETEQDMDEEMAVLSDAAAPMEPEVSSLGRYEAQEHGSMGSDEPDELMLSGDASHFYSHYPISANEAVSKWQLKGKRNIRNLTKRSLDATDGKGYIYGSYPEDKDFRTEIIGLDNGCSSSRAAFRGRNSVGRNIVDWDDWSLEDRPSSRGYWDIKRERFDPLYDGRHQFGGRSGSILIDVDVKVQASYQKEPVPIVSLMSKFNGKAIIGHPIQIETLEDGSSSNLISTIDDFCNEPIENDGNTALPQAWRTARRTANFRVPRPHLSSTLDGDEAAYDFPFLDRESKPAYNNKKGNLSHKAGHMKRNVPPSDRKLKKMPKKSSSSSSQKTRTLSSIATEHKFGNKQTHDSSSSQMDGLIKPESSGPTTVACIPVKLVFSRLLEKINRPPLRAAGNGALLNSDVERNPP